MTSEVLALILQCTFLLTALVLRTLLHYARTGTTGLRVLSKSSLVQRMSVALLVAGGAASLAAAPVQGRGDMTPLLESGITLYVGLCVAVAGIVLVLVAQEYMRDSWRIGVDTRERTTLISTGPFRYVRNPIFSGMLMFWAGIALMVPNVLAIGGLLMAFVGIEGHVRHVEEPYLLRTHGAEYRRYAARTGRLLPGIGRLK